jgi:hypothetical protein
MKSGFFTKEHWMGKVHHQFLEVAEKFVQEAYILFGYTSQQYASVRYNLKTFHRIFCTAEGGMSNWQEAHRSDVFWQWAYVALTVSIWPSDTCHFPEFFASKMQSDFSNNLYHLQTELVTVVPNAIWNPLCIVITNFTVWNHSTHYAFSSWDAILSTQCCGLQGLDTQVAQIIKLNMQSIQLHLVGTMSFRWWAMLP